MSWKWVDDQIDELAKRLKNRELRYISGIPRGGLIPAIMLSHKLGVTYIPFDEAKKFGRHDLRFKNEDILLVDDICDSGVTLEKAPGVYTAVLHHKPTSVFSPSVYAEEVGEEWIVYPWERDDSEAKQDYLQSDEFKEFAAFVDGDNGENEGLFDDLEKPHYIAGMTNDKEGSFMKFQNKLKNNKLILKINDIDNTKFSIQNIDDLKKKYFTNIKVFFELKSINEDRKSVV